jgi:hypothetical protein
VPAGRWKVAPVCGSTSVKFRMSTVDCCTLTTTESENVAQATPITFNVVNATGGALSGLPHAHRVTGTPRRSTSTAVPACNTAANEVMCPLTKPWLVTAMSVRRTTEVSVDTNTGMSAGRRPNTLAQAAAWLGWVCRNATSCCGLQLPTLAVPPKSPIALPTTVPPERAAVGWGAPMPTGGVIGLAPVEVTGSSCRLAGCGAGAPQAAAPTVKATATTATAPARRRFGTVHGNGRRQRRPAIATPQATHRAPSVRERTSGQ